MLQEGYQERGRALGGKSVGASEGLDRGRKSRSVASLCSQCMFQKSEGGGGGAALQRAGTAWAWAEPKVQVEVNRKHRVERCFFGAQASLARTRGCTVEVLVPTWRCSGWARLAHKQLLGGSHNGGACLDGCTGSSASPSVHAGGKRALQALGVLKGGLLDRGVC